MRLPSKRKSILIAAVLLLVGVGAVLGWRAFRVGGPSAGQSGTLHTGGASHASPVLQKIEIYSYDAFHLCLDIRESKITMLSSSLAEGIGMALFEIPITRAETARIERLVSSCPSLRTFEPKTRWFGPSGYIGAASLMVFVWSDRTRVYAIPSDKQIENLPRQAKEIYERIYEVDEAMLLARKEQNKHTHWARRKPPLPQNHPRRIEYRRNLHRYARMSLPNNRVGW